MNQNNMRPGVYSSYSMTSRYATPRSQKDAVVLMDSPSAMASDKLIFTSYSQAIGKFQSFATALNCVAILFESGVSRVVFIGVDSENYSPALALLESEHNIGIVVSDASQNNAVEDIKKWVDKNSEQQKEMLCFFAAEQKLVAKRMSQHLNFQRAVVTFPALVYNGYSHKMYSACAMAGAVLAQNDPVYNFNGFSFPNMVVASESSEEDIQELLRAGVSVFEGSSQGVQCIRLITSKITEQGAADYSLRSVNTVLIIDDVISTVRKSLASRLKGVRISTQSLDSISSQVVVELNAKKNSGLLEDYKTPLVYPHDTDPSICVVEISFTVAHVVSQIHIVAHIQI